MRSIYTARYYWSKVSSIDLSSHTHTHTECIRRRHLIVKYYFSSQMSRDIFPVRRVWILGLLSELITFHLPYNHIHYCNNKHSTWFLVYSIFEFSSPTIQAALIHFRYSLLDRSTFHRKLFKRWFFFTSVVHVIDLESSVTLFTHRRFLMQPSSGHLFLS